MIVNDIINDIIDVCHDGYRYLSNIKCIYVGILSLVISIDICQSKNMDILYTSKWYIFWYVWYNMMLMGVYMII